MKNKHCHKNEEPFTNKNIFTVENLKHVEELASERAGKREDLKDDLYQEGCLALQKAFETFNPSLGVYFWRYAEEVLGHAMSKAERKINRVWSTSLEEVYDMCPSVPFDSDEDFPQKDVYDHKTLTPYQRFELADTIKTVRYLVSQLPYKERVAVTLFYGLDGLYERPLEYIGAELGCSAEGARKICARGVDRLHGWLAKPQYNLCA